MVDTPSTAIFSDDQAFNRMSYSEQRVFEFFKLKFPPEWEIYPHPFLNGLHPSFVLLNPVVGIAVYDVLDDHSYTNMTPYHRENLVFRAWYLKKEIFDLYLPRLRSQAGHIPAAAAVVTSGVIAPRISENQLNHIVVEGRQLLGRKVNLHPDYYTFVGRESIENGEVSRVLPSVRFRSSKFMNMKLAADFRTWLVDPDYSKFASNPLPLDSKQQRLVKSPFPGGHRIKGPAGSGKSVVIAARAAHLSSQNLNVLVISFNKTLWHYLRDLALRYPKPGQHLAENVTWLHFHDWCKRVIRIEAGLNAEYKAIWARYFSTNPCSETNTDSLEYEPNIDNENLTRVLDVEIPNLALQAIESALAARTANTYDAILVDEGQDFRREWWELLQKALNVPGEMWLVADNTQDIYGRSTRWTDLGAQGAGFRGTWVKLDGSHRLPAGMIPVLQRFVELFLNSDSADPPQFAQSRLVELDQLRVEWWQIDPDDDSSLACFDAVTDQPGLADPNRIAFTDVTLLTGSNWVGLKTVSLLEGKGIRVAHTFARTRQERSDRKAEFFFGDHRVKATTIHSYKGWESRSLVVHISHDAEAEIPSEESLKTIYTGLTRLKAHLDGAYLTVVCSEPSLVEFGKSLAGFRDLRGRYRRRLPVSQYPTDASNIPNFPQYRYIDNG